MRPSKLMLALAALLMAGGSLAACGSSSHSASPTPTAASSSSPSSGPTATGTTITIKNFAFSPSTLSVKPGAMVTVHNADSATHTVTSSAKGAFNTGDVAPGGTQTFTAPSKPGSYPYICSIHQFMHGTLMVS